MKKLPQLLAPAGSPAALAAAIAGGADAVYLSGKRFGARKFAANFDEPALALAIDYAHLAGVKVYVTVNTLIRENELHDAAVYLLRLYEMGADAVLLQDLGLSLLAGRALPELERHASTQMTIHNKEGAIWANRAGFRRAVLAREVGLDEIKTMGQELEKEKDTALQGIGLEVFVHGALCYSYSGQCLLSSAIGGRSGNRGMCAQPCRKPYVLLRGEKDRYGRPTGLAAQPQRERFLISTRDLCVYRHLDRIVRSPIESLKIEGRMKSPEYVAIVTRIYKRALQAVIEAGPKVHLYGASGLNVCNHLTVQALAPPLEQLTLSPELSARQLADTVAAVRLIPDAPQIELMVQGNLEVMVAEDCMPLPGKGEYDAKEFWGLQDMRRIFPLRLDDDHRTHIFNSAETCLLDQMPEIFAIDLDGVAVDARGRTVEYAREMTKIYKKAIDLTHYPALAYIADEFRHQDVFRLLLVAVKGFFALEFGNEDQIIGHARLQKVDAHLEKLDLADLGR